MSAIKISSKVDEAAWNELRDLAREDNRSVSGTALRGGRGVPGASPGTARTCSGIWKTRCARNEELGKLLAQ